MASIEHHDGSSLQTSLHCLVVCSDRQPCRMTRAVHSWAVFDRRQSRYGRLVYWSWSMLEWTDERCAAVWTIRNHSISNIGSRTGTGQHSLAAIHQRVYSATPLPLRTSLASRPITSKDRIFRNLDNTVSVFLFQVWRGLPFGRESAGSWSWPSSCR